MKDLIDNNLIYYNLLSHLIEYYNLQTSTKYTDTFARIIFYVNEHVLIIELIMCYFDNIVQFDAMTERLD
jgi:hypothetical protein